MPIRTELNLRLPNSPGALAGVCRSLAVERVHILAMALDTSGHLHLLVDNIVRALTVLRSNRHAVSERDVLIVSAGEGAGSLSGVLSLIEEAGANVEYAYAASADVGAPGAVVLGVDDAMRVAAAAGV
jgi:hypothetical protein